MAATSVIGSVGKQVAGPFGGAGAEMGGLKKLLSFAGKHKMGSAVGAYFVIQMIMNAMKGHGGTLMQQGLESHQLKGQMAVNPEDAYYKAMLPSLSGQRQSAQNALLQAVLAGSGQTMQVPGERLIGGQ